jgi:hypothetical protein
VKKAMEKHKDKNWVVLCPLCDKYFQFFNKKDGSDILKSHLRLEVLRELDLEEVKPK